MLVFATKKDECLLCASSALGPQTIQRSPWCFSPVCIFKYGSSFSVAF
jgi:hypothetical protein